MSLLFSTLGIPLGDCALFHAPLSQVALSSIGKFLLYGFIRPTSPNAAEAMNRISEGVTNCRFEATDKSSYEVCLLYSNHLWPTLA